MSAATCLLAICLAWFGSGPQWPLPTDVDCIEVNYTPRFTQVILWQWSADYNRYDCVGYWLIDDISRDLGGMPTQSASGWSYATYRGRAYRAPHVRETWTRNDRERDNARLHPPRWRLPELLSHEPEFLR